MDFYLWKTPYAVIDGKRLYLVGKKSMVYDAKRRKIHFEKAGSEAFLLPKRNEKLDRLFGVFTRNYWKERHVLFVEGSKDHGYRVGSDPELSYSRITENVFFDGADDMKGGVKVGPLYLDTYLSFLRGNLVRVEIPAELHIDSIRKSRVKGRKGKIAVGDWQKGVIYGYRNVNCDFPELEELSPKNIGPIKINGKRFENLHNMWYSSLVWRICNRFHEYRERVRKEKEPIEPNNAFIDESYEYFLWGDDKISVTEARKRYWSLYSEKVKNTKFFLSLKSLLDKGYNLRLFGLEGRDIADISLFPYEEEMKNLGKRFGYVIVLAKLLA